MKIRFRHLRERPRRGAALALAAFLMVLVLGLAAFALDIGYIVLVRTQLQTATEAGLIVARQYLQSQSAGGSGRLSTNKVVVLVTDGVPNLYVGKPADINSYINQSDSKDFYNNGAYWCDAAIMQCLKMQADRWNVYPVPVGLSCDYGFMDRLARCGGTADDNGRSPRGSGNPADYEQRLTDIFKKIITNPKVRLVQ